MRTCIGAAIVAVTLIAAPVLPARAANPMGYRLLAQQEAAQLPSNHGALGLDVERGQQITDSGMTFDIMRIKQVRTGSSGERAGLNQGDQIIAVDGRVFPSIAIFAAYIGSLTPGRSISVDYIPAGGGPAQAQRIALTVAAAGRPVPAQPPAPVGADAAGMSSGAKVAIGVGAAALLGCYEMGCFSRRGGTWRGQPTPQPGQPWNGPPQR